MLVPKLRFKEFTDEYNSMLLNEITNSVASGKITRDIGYGIYNVYGSTGIINKAPLFDYSGKKVLVARVGANAGTVNKINEDCCISDNTLVIDVKSDIQNDYLYYYLLQYNPQKLIFGSGQPLITGGQLKKINVLFPNEKEQKKIVDFLSLIDKKIEQQSKKIEVLKLYKKGLLERELSNDYDLIQLSSILKERKTFSEKGLDYPHVTLSKEGIYDKGERYNRDFLVKDEEKKYKITKLNDICYNPANLKFGVISLNEYGNAIFSPIYVTFEINNEANPQYLKFYLTRNNFINAVRKYEQGTVYERMSVSSEDFLKFKIKLPDLKIQNAIAHNFNTLDKKISLEIKKIDNLYKLKKGLIQNMFV